MKQGDNVLIWGASGGLGGFATQYALNGGATPVCVVSNEEKAQIARSMGAELIINRAEEGYKFWKDEHTQDPKEWRRFGKRIRELTGGEDIDIVFEHPGRETFGASVFVTRKGGTITTCASTTGYMHEYDNRYLWMNLKRIISSHFANYRESWEANRLIAKGMIHPTLSRTYPLEDVGQAALDVHKNQHQGKVGVLCLAPEEGLGVLQPGDARPSTSTRSTGSAASDVPQEPSRHETHDTLTRHPDRRTQANLGYGGQVLSHVSTAPSGFTVVGRTHLGSEHAHEVRKRHERPVRAVHLRRRFLQHRRRRRHTGLLRCRFRPADGRRHGHERR